MLSQEIDRLTRLVEEKDRLAREATVRAGQSLDELERAKERIRKDAERELEQRSRGILLGFIEVLDDLDRALAAANENDHARGLVQGMDLVRKQFLARLGQHGVTPCPSMGQRFDPVRHEAVSTVPVSDPAKDGVVVGVIRDAYLMGNETLRPAYVAVGRLA